MATLEFIKVALRRNVTESTPRQRLSDTQYRDGFETLVQGARWRTPSFDTRVRVSVMEIGPGPKSVLGYLPHHMRRKISRYTASEPNRLFASQLGEWLSPATLNAEESPMPGLRGPPDIRPAPFTLDTGADADEKQSFDVVLFCHSMYGLKPQHRYIERALEMLDKRTSDGMVVVFHREGALQLNGLVCRQVASFPTGTVSVTDDDATLSRFATFLTGFDVDQVTRAEWRKVCRAMGGREEATPHHLTFGAPETMMAFNHDASTALPKLATQVPIMEGEYRRIKSWEARAQHPAVIVRPTEIRHIQLCVQWALDHEVGLTVMGGSHSAHCLRSHVVSIDMSAFNQVHILTPAKDEEYPGSDSDPQPLALAEAGCNTDSIIRKTMEAELTVPLGSRPSVGAGLWLQGGIGHLARLHGLACDAILGAVMVDVESGRVLCIGHVPSQHRPAGSVRPHNHMDILWAIKGAGTNFGIVVSVVFQAHPAPVYSVRNWVLPLNHGSEAQSRLRHLGQLAANLPRHCSADLYLYREKGQLSLGVTRIDVSTAGLGSETDVPDFADLGPERDAQTVDGVGLFETELYMCGMNGGHGGGKTSAFKRCMFLKDLRAGPVAEILATAIETCPSPLCYFHLLQGGGKVDDVEADNTAFGCHDWDYACVVTGVWSRDQDATEVARAVVRWVYRVVSELLPFSRGIYGADLGPDPRDSALATHAFGPNRGRLDRLKLALDPHNILAYACPLPKVPVGPRVVILVTGESGAGKDYSAQVCISDATKRAYAAATGASLDRLLGDRLYKEQHRNAMEDFFQKQLHQNPNLPEKHFLDMLHSTDDDAAVLFITGMRDEAPVTKLAHLRPDCRFLDICVQASEGTRRFRKGLHGGGAADGARSDETKSNGERPSVLDADYRPSLIFNNDLSEREAVEKFAKARLLPLLHEDLSRLYQMVRTVPSFPRPGIAFRHVLNIAQQPDGLAICTNQLMTQFHGDWDAVDAVACCEAGGFIFASALAARVNVPLALIRDAGKLAPPTVSSKKSQSYISSVASASGDPGPAAGGTSVVVVDDVLATGKTLCTVLHLLKEAGVEAANVSILVVAEFPVHRGRELLRSCGYGRAHVHSLLVFDGA
ncbi:hypothetical protein PG993_003099 [Apiospora rasikravindrae]|uniref:FAD-binding PCMH-type domain-containing protein n=1 Tax=Apiospora rasikravindrae TaxID=990691 RepID=A0ABR1TYK7_9PEZI